MKIIFIVVAILSTLVGCANNSGYTKDQLNEERRCYDQAYLNRNQINITPQNTNKTVLVKLSNQEDYVKVCMAQKGLTK